MQIELSLAGSSVLYHLIQMEYAIKAMQADKFRLAPANEGVEAEFGKGQYFLSLARSKHSHYFREEISFAHVVFVLDGAKMNANYQIKPVNYWHNQKFVSHDEMEDRLVADKMYIPCLRYVKEIHFMQEAEAKYKTNDSLTMALLAKRAGIQLFQYADFNAFTKLDKRKVIKLDVSDKKKRKFGTQQMHEYTDGSLKAWYYAATIELKGGRHAPFYSQFMAGAKTKRDQSARDRIARTIKDYNRYTEVEKAWVRDFNRMLDSAKHNTGEDHKFLEKIKLIKRKHKLDTAGFLDYVRKRWQ